MSLTIHLTMLLPVFLIPTGQTSKAGILLKRLFQPQTNRTNRTQTDVLNTGSQK